MKDSWYRKVCVAQSHSMQCLTAVALAVQVKAVTLSLGTKFAACPAVKKAKAGKAT